MTTQLFLKRFFLLTALVALTLPQGCGDDEPVDDLGVGSIEKKPAVIETPEGDTIAIRHKMYLSLSYDHRVVDGMLGGNFLHFIADYLENWQG